MIINEIGNRIFHLNFINISYRNRGYVPRIHNNIIIINNIIIFEVIEFKEVKNIIVVMIIKIIILIYSAKKIKANQPPIYSTLNPDTNSDSPSAKSKGLRLVSAKHVINQNINNNIFPQAKYKNICDFEICIKE